MSSSSAYNGQSSWSVDGTWSINANTVTQLTKDKFVSNSSSDTEASEAIGNAIMQNDGTLKCPYPSVYVLNIVASLSDFCDMTLPANQIPSLIFQFVYVPFSTDSPAETFIMATVELNQNNPWVSIAQRTDMVAGDYIKVLMTSSLPINNFAVGNQSQLVYNDDANNTQMQIYTGVSGNPPAYNVINKTSYSSSAPIIGSKAVFTLTADGKNGHSKFSSGITDFTVSVQSLAKITDTTDSVTAGSACWDPFPADLKTATAHFRTSKGGLVNDNEYVATAHLEGW